jgi:hypothetical protein
MTLRERLGKEVFVGLGARQRPELLIGKEAALCPRPGPIVYARVHGSNPFPLGWYSLFSY